MRVSVPSEQRPGERRVAVVPDTVRRLVAAGLHVVVESGAGNDALVTDEDYVAAGDVARSAQGDLHVQLVAELLEDANGPHVTRVDKGVLNVDVLEGSDAVLSVQPLASQQLELLKPGALTISFLPLGGKGEDTIRASCDAGVTAFSLELLPRISRAQSMDALTSQALVAGYRAAIIAADRLPKFMPLLMTAAGTMPPAKVLVLGAGVAGLQAIGTSRRLGAVVSAYDVRPSSADEIRSMGATFVQLDLEALDGAGGYAREMGEERSRRQRELLAPYLADSDAVITTAAVPNRQAPLLVTREMVAAMRLGSVVVDLAAETGGNVEGSVAGEETDINGVRVWGGKDVASQMPVHASRLYAANVANLLLHMTKDGVIEPDWDDEIVIGSWVTRDGALRDGLVA